MKITTDNKWKQFVYGYDVPEKVLSDIFEHLDEDETVDSFFKYRNVWYHISDFINASEEMLPWHGYSSDSFFSGIVIEISSDGEEYKVGTALT